MKVIMSNEDEAVIREIKLEDAVTALNRITVGRNIRPYASVENVVTHVDYRRKGYARECLDYVKRIAEQANCYKMMLLTGSKDLETFQFYEKAGYNSSDKTAFIQWLGMDKP